MLRVNTGNPYQKKALLIWSELEPDEGELPVSGAMELRMFNDAALSRMIGSVQSCLNDREFTLVKTNGGLNEFLGYSDEEIRERFDNKYLRMIYALSLIHI